MARKKHYSTRPIMDETTLIRHVVPNDPTIFPLHTPPRALDAGETLNQKEYYTARTLINMAEFVIATDDTAWARIPLPADQLIIIAEDKGIDCTSLRTQLDLPALERGSQDVLARS